MVNDREEARKMRDRIEATREKIKDKTDQAIDASSEAVAQYIDDLPERVKKAAAAARDKATEIQQKANDYANDRPWQLAGWAALGGFLMGMMMTRRQSHD